MSCNCSECEGAWHHWIEGMTQSGAVLECKHCEKLIRVPNKTAYLESDDRQHHFWYECEVCDCNGVIDLEIDRISQRVHCPQECGAIYVLMNKSASGHPDLRIVVRPMNAVYEEGPYGE